MINKSMNLLKRGREEVARIPAEKQPEDGGTEFNWQKTAKALAFWAGDNSPGRSGRSIIIGSGREHCRNHLF